MKRILLILPVIALLFPATAFAQKASELKYVDARSLMLINQGYDNTELTYSRLPADMKPYTRKAVWELGQNSAGLAIRFSSDSRTIGIRWTLLNYFIMHHRPARASGASTSTSSMRTITGSLSARPSPTARTPPRRRS